MNRNRTDNEVLQKALGHLSHPIILISITILLINDWFLRIYWPGWLTGKIGDFAWMFFFPFVLAAAVSIIIPPKHVHQEKSVRIISFFLAFLIFTLPKIFPAVNGSLNDFLTGMIGVPTNIRRDPTDLMALLSLGLAWRFWDHEVSWKKDHLIPGWISFQLAVLLTIANAPAQDYGIDTLNIDQDQIIAQSAYFEFASEDGGLSWEQTVFSLSGDPASDQVVTGSIQFDYIPGQVIRISRDGGDSYPYQLSLIPTSQPLKLKYEQKNGSPVFAQGPLDAIIDPGTGNIIFAMGHEGILVFTHNNIWEWVPAGDYQQLQFNPNKELGSLILGEILLSIGFGFLIINTFTVNIHKGVFRKVLLVLGWGVFITNLVLLPPGIFIDNQLRPYHAILPIIFYFIQSAGMILFLILGILDLIKIFPDARKYVRNIVIVFACEITLFIIPYILWGFNILQSYSTAVILAASLGGITLISTYLILTNPLNPAQLGNTPENVNPDQNDKSLKN